MKENEMNKILLFFLFFNSCILKGQDLKLVTIRDSTRQYILEEFFVIKNTDKKHTKYNSYYLLPDSAIDKKQYLKEEGNYKFGIKHGEWTYYTDLKSYGEHKVERIESFNNGMLSGRKYFIQKNSMNWTVMKIGLEYPKYAINNGITGRVFVKFFLNEDCSIKEYNIVSSPDSSLSRATLECIQRNIKEEDFKIWKDTCLNKEVIMPFSFMMN